MMPGVRRGVARRAGVVMVALMMRVAHQVVRACRAVRRGEGQVRPVLMDDACAVLEVVAEAAANTAVSATQSVASTLLRPGFEVRRTGAWLWGLRPQRKAPGAVSLCQIGPLDRRARVAAAL